MLEVRRKQNATSLIHDLVREGRATPHDAAVLLKMRREVRRGRERQELRRHPVVGVLVAIGVFILALFGVRHDPLN